jgi:transposase
MAYKPQQRKKILDKYRRLVESGVTVLAAAKQCGVPYFTISRWLKAAGQAQPKPNLPAAQLAGKRKLIQYTKAQQAEMLARYEKLVAGGARVLDAAKTLGVAYLTIRRWQDAAAGRPSYPRHKHSGRPAKTGRRPKKVAAREMASEARYVLTTHDGYRIEADRARDLAKVLAKLK